jgi:hypothetical protein
VGLIIPALDQDAALHYGFCNRVNKFKEENWLETMQRAADK